MEKTYVAVKRGLILSPKHREQMGMALWLYLYLQDLADWDDGTVYAWTDSQASDKLKIPLPTVRYQRKQLEEHGYIVCRKTQRGQAITITKYEDPRKMGQIPDAIPSNNQLSHGNNNNAQSNNPSDNPSDNPLIVPVITLSSNSTIKGQKSVGEGAPKQRLKPESKKPDPPPPAITVFQEVRKRMPPTETWPTIARVVGCAEADLSFWREVLIAYASAGWNRMSVTGPLDFFKRKELPGSKPPSSANGRKQTSSQYDQRWVEHAAKRNAAKEKT